MVSKRNVKIAVRFGESLAVHLEFFNRSGLAESAVFPAWRGVL